MTGASCVSLLGSDYPELEEVGAADLGADLAAAISRGRFPKWYSYVDPNEDAVVVAREGDAVLMVAADGHHGFDAAQAAVDSVARMRGRLLGSPGPATLTAAFAAAQEAVAAAVGPLAEPRSASATAMTVVLGRPGAAWTAGAGDTVAVRIRGRRADVFPGSVDFLHPGSGLAGLDVADLPLRAGDIVVVASDGATDFLGRRWPRQLTTLAREVADMPSLVGAVVGAAHHGGAGDNVCVAAWRLA